MEAITIDQKILIQAFFGAMSTVLTIIVGLATYTWRKHTKSVDRQNDLLSSIDKNLALACQTIEQHSAMLEEGKNVHRSLNDVTNKLDKRVSIIEAKMGLV